MRAFGQQREKLLPLWQSMAKKNSVACRLGFRWCLVQNQSCLRYVKPEINYINGSMRVILN
jgi:hypothetical protein